MNVLTLRLLGGVEGAAATGRRGGILGLGLHMCHEGKTKSIDIPTTYWTGFSLASGSGGSCRRERFAGTVEPLSASARVRFRGRASSVDSCAWGTGFRDLLPSDTLATGVALVEREVLVFFGGRGGSSSTTFRRFTTEVSREVSCFLERFLEVDTTGPESPDVEALGARPRGCLGLGSSAEAFDSLAAFFGSGFLRGLVRRGAGSSSSTAGRDFDAALVRPPRVLDSATG